MIPPADSPAPVLELSRIGYTYGSGVHAFRALTEVDLRVDVGHTLGIVGESGSGKSTLARLVMGALRPTEGAVRFRGADTAALRGAALRRHRTRVQMVFQDPHDSLD
ncbi:ATP-binding cassette domain-containing protein, partial [Microbacterium sp.]|uniref:ATP-binding cassette domain-containing protein n=1 Tax=Microbacterium sp. TaxID=51671 RepID=UPI003C71499F